MSKTVGLWALCWALGCGGAAMSARPAGGGGARAPGVRSVRPAPAPSGEAMAVTGVGSVAAPASPGVRRHAQPSAASPPAAPSLDAAAAAGGVMTTTTTVTVTVETPPPPPVESSPQPYEPTARVLTAASVGDHDRRGNYLEYLARHGHEARRFGLDLGRRVRFRVVDAQRRPINDARVWVSVGGRTVEGRTHADGVWDFFPGVSVPWAQDAARVRVVAAGAQAELRVPLPVRGDGQDVTLRLETAQSERPRVLDLAFLIDVTGSMEDELRYVNAEVADIVARVQREAPEVQVRVGAVFYRDRTDSVPLQRIAFTHDVQAFAAAMGGVRAFGGGDYPEDLDAGLHEAMRGLRWSEGNAVRVLVVIADAPPQRYATQYGYRQAMAEAAARGIRLLPVAASGANREVEFLFRAMGSFTSTPYVYLTDDSGVGRPHLEADTDRVAVEYFNDLLTRLMVSDVAGWGMHEPGALGAER